MPSGYQFSTNNTPATGAVAQYTLFGRMLAAAWASKADSDGSTYSSSGTQVTGGGSGANGLGNANAWKRMQDPGGLREYIWQRGSNNTQWRIKYSKAAHFTGGSPSATQTPSAADEQILLGGGTDASPTFGTLYGTDGAYRFSCGAQATPIAVQPGGVGAAINQYNFFSVGWTIGAGANSQTNGVFVCSVDPTASAIFNTFDSDPIINYFGNGGSSSIFGSDLIGGGGSVTGYMSSGYKNLSTAAPPSVNNMSADPSNGKDGALTIFFQGGSPAWMKGFTTDLYWALTGNSGTAPRPTGSVGSLVTNQDRLYINQCTVPWDGSNPTP